MLSGCRNCDPVDDPRKPPQRRGGQGKPQLGNDNGRVYESTVKTPRISYTKKLSSADQRLNRDIYEGMIVSDLIARIAASDALWSFAYLP